MRVIRSIKSIQKVIKELKLKNKSIGFVPTMGALHEGHLSLMKKSRRENDISVVSIFINPTQFNDKYDFEKYPRGEKKDKLLVQKENIDIIFYPSAEEMYPKKFLTSVEVESLTQQLCGKFRPGHFHGVTTVVSKLLNIVTPDVLYLGQKDAQQAQVIKKMVADLNFSVRVKVCPTVRERDGLALSSRNQHLTDAQRQEAPVLFEALKEAKRNILSGEHNVRTIRRQVKDYISKRSAANIEYVACVDANSLEPFKENVENKIMIALAIKFGKTRLIDNIVFSVK